MSDDVVSVIPADPYWQPSREVGHRAAELVAGLVSGRPDADDVDIDVSWHDVVTVVDCGENFERIGCPLCAASIDVRWWGDLLEERADTGFDDLLMALPCCGAQASLNDLIYEWPCGFAKFEIAVWNPEQLWFSEEKLRSIADVLGRPVRQIRAHI